MICVQPTQKLQGAIQLPGSKSYSIRAFIIASCGGSSQIYHASDSTDALTSLQVIRSLGAQISGKKGKTSIKAAKTKLKTRHIRVNESGTTLRFILPLASLYTRDFTVVGTGSLRGRPNHHLVRTLKAMGLEIKGKGNRHSVPLNITGGKLKGGTMTIDGSLSSQFISALLITCPLLDEDSELKITGKKLVSSDYVTMTRNLLRASGISVVKKSERHYKIKGRQKFKGLKNFFVPSDLGLAAFPLAAGALLDSNIILKGDLNQKLGQADGAIIPFLRKMKARLNVTQRGIHIKGPFALKGAAFSLKDCPDLVPIMAVLALFAKGQTRLKNIAHARAKESNRITDLRKELLKAGAKIKEKKDELIIIPQKSYKSDVTLNPHNDHRLAMAFTVLGLKIGTRISNIECTHKSYPKFISDMKKLKAKLRAI